MQYLAACPVCDGSTLVSSLTCKDYTVSHETFRLQKCTACGFVMTNPRPEQALLPRYYESDAYISHSTKSRSITDQLYKLSRHFTLKWKFNLVRQYSRSTPESLLDYGCGTGAFLKECKNNHLRVAGVEPSPAARDQATETTNATIYPELGDVEGEYDAITLWHVLEHVTDLHGTLMKLKAALRENGTMFIAVPNLLSQDAKVYGEYWAAYDVPRHLWHFSRKTMKQTLEHHGLQCVNVLPMKLDAYYVSLLSEKYKNGTNNIFGMSRAAYNGWRSNQAAAKNQEYSSLIYIVRP